MKKHDEGYTLVLVLVVLVVICLVATSVMTSALQNLKRQEASIARMQDKYEAQGKMERIVTELEAQVSGTVNGTYVFSKNVMQAIVRDQGTFGQICKSDDGKSLLVSVYTINNTQTVSVQCVIQLNGMIESEERHTENNGSEFYAYTLKDPSVHYASYTIQYLEGGATE